MGAPPDRQKKETWKKKADTTYTPNREHSARAKEKRSCKREEKAKFLKKIKGDGKKDDAEG